MANLLYDNPTHYVIDAGKKGYEVYKNEGVAGVRRASIGRSLGLSRAIAEADKRHANEVATKTVGNNPMPTVGSRQSHSFHRTKPRQGHRIGKR